MIVEKKRDFFGNIKNKSTEKNYKRLVLNLEKYLEDADMEVGELGLDHLTDFMKHYVKPSTNVSARSHTSMLIKFLRETHNIELDNADYNYIVGSSVIEQDYISKHFLDDLISVLKNFQDIIIPILIFHGVTGKEGIEMRALTNNDVLNNGVRLRNEKGELTGEFVEIESEYIKYLKMAKNETIYYKKNGENIHDPRHESSPLCESNYLIRVVGKTDSKQDQMANKYVHQNRFEMIRNLDVVKELSEEYNLSTKALTLKQIKKSGMIYEFKKLIKDEGVEPKEARRIVTEKFRVKNNWAMTDFLMVEKVEELY